MEKILTVRAFDVFDEDGNVIAENLKTFEQAEAFIIAHDKKTHADWLLAHIHEHGRERFKHRRYRLLHSEGKVVADDVFTKMSFKELCDEAFGWRAISGAEFIF